MDWRAFIGVIPYFLSAVICAVIGLLAYQRRQQPGAFPFALLALAEVVWTLGFIFQQISPDLAGKLFWNNVQFLGAVGAPLAFCAFGFHFTRQTGRLSQRIRYLTRAIGAAVLLLVWTDGLHGQFRTDPHLVAGTPFSSLVFQNGPAFGVYPLYGYSLIIIGAYVLVANYISAPRIYRLQIATVLVGILIPWVATLVTWMEWVPALLHEIAPITFAISNVIVSWAMFRYRLFDIVPVAYNTLVENMEDGVIVVDRELRIADMNHAAQEILGVTLYHALGKSFLGELPELYAALPDLGNQSPAQTELELEVAGEKRCYEARISPLFDNRRIINGNLILLQNITQRKRTEEQLQRLAVTDPGTGLFNRRHFFTLAEREFERAMRTGRSLSVIIFDIDHFKGINDRYGHIFGDLVLATLASRSQACLRAYDVIARYGGEEFVVLLPETDIAQACQVGERLRSSIADTPFENETEKASITISLGVAELLADEDVIFDRLLDHADQALYEAKRANRNCVRAWNHPLSAGGTNPDPL